MMRSTLHFLLAGACLCIALALPLAAQQTTTAVNSSSIAPGIRKGQIEFSTRRGVVDVETLEVDFAQPRVSARIVAPLGGINDSATLESLSASVGGRAAIALEPRPTLGADAAPPPGLRRSGKDLLSWPAAPVPHLALLPEGSLLPILPVTGRGSVDFDDGTSMTLHSVNGALPAPGGGGASVYTGTLRAEEVAVLGWPEDLVIVELQPVRDGSDPHELFLDVPGVDRRLRPVGTTRRSDLRLRTGRVALVLVPPVPEEILRRVQRSFSVVTAPRAPQEAMAEAVLPSGGILLRDGALLAGIEPARLVFNALAIDARGRRLMAIAPGTGRNRGTGVPMETLAPFLAAEGYGDLVELPGRAALVLPDARQTRDHRAAANVPTRLALVVKDEPAVLSLPGITGDLHRIRGLVVQGTRREFPQNQPGALRDERLLPDPSLSQFWAIPFDPRFGSSGSDNPNTLRILLPRAMPVAALELAHAEECGFSPAFSLRGYRLLGKERRDGPWRPLLDVTHREPVRRERIAIPGAPRVVELRLGITAPNFLPGGDVARIAELFVWSTEPEVQRR